MSNNYSSLVSSSPKRASIKQETGSNPSSPIPKFFLTSAALTQKQLYGLGYALVLQLHKDLSRMVDNIGLKVSEAVDRSQSQFLIAYRNHMKKIKTQLEQLKHKLQIHQNETSVEKVNLLEKQLRLFREQSLKMYDKLEIKNRECEQLSIRLKQMKDQNTFLQQEVKKLMKSNKLLQIERNNVSSSIIHNASIDNSMINITQDNFSKSKIIKRPNSHNRINSLKYQPQIKQICKDVKIEGQVNRLICNIVKDKNSTISRLQSKWKQNHQSTTDLRIQNQLQTFFLECVESVRKDIYKKKIKVASQRWNVIDFQMFKSLDKIKIISYFVSNEKVMRHIYNQVFNKLEIHQPKYYHRLHIKSSQREGRAASTFLN